MTKSFHAKKFCVSVVAAVLVILLLTIFFIAAKSSFPDFLEQKVFYFLCTDSSERQGFLESNAENIRRMGGAGVVYNYLGKNYLIAAVYDRQSDADDVLLKLKQSHPGALVLKLTCKAATLRSRKRIMSNPKTAKILEASEALTSEIIALALNFHSGKLGTGEVSKFVLNKKLSLETKLESYDLTSEFEQEVNEYIRLKISALDGFLSSFYESTKRKSLVMELATNLSLQSFELHNNLINSKK